VIGVVFGLCLLFAVAFFILLFRRLSNEQGIVSCCVEIHFRKTLEKYSLFVGTELKESKQTENIANNNNNDDSSRHEYAKFDVISTIGLKCFDE
jgi:hypothetical protein